MIDLEKIVAIALVSFLASSCSSPSELVRAPVETESASELRATVGELIVAGEAIDGRRVVVRGFITYGPHLIVLQDHPNSKVGIALEIPSELIRSGESGNILRELLQPESRLGSVPFNVMGVVSARRGENASMIITMTDIRRVPEASANLVR